MERSGAKIGTVLPQDYKALVNLYGVGSFGGYVCLLNPFVPDLGPNSGSNFYRAMNFLSQMEKEMEDDRRENPEYYSPFPAYPATDSLLPWGHECSDGGIQCWLTKGSPDDWGCIILDNDWSEEYHQSLTTATGFLVGWLTGQIIISYYPKLPLPQPLFQPSKML